MSSALVLRVRCAVRSASGAPFLRTARLLHVSAPAAATPSKEFLAASKAVQAIASPPSNGEKLKLYALFKQATVGPNNTPKPGIFDVVGKYKWEAWTALGALSSTEAEQHYISLCASLGAGAAPGPAETSASTLAPRDRYAASGGDILVSTAGPVRTITLNRPAKRNAITLAMYDHLVAHLLAAAIDPVVTVTVLRGAGTFYCAGNDLSNFAEAATAAGGLPAAADRGERTLNALCGALIDFPKILVVGLNGPAVGIAVTTLPLADFVVAAHSATLHAPLTALGQTPEGASSLTFMRALGPARASDLLLAGRKISAATAVEWGLVSEVAEAGSGFEAALAARVAALTALPPQALLAGKRMLRERARPELHAALLAESALIKERWQSDECTAAVMRFLAAGSRK